MIKDAPHGPAAFNVRGGAIYLGLGETRFRELLRSGAIRIRRYGRRVVISKAELDAWLAGRVINNE